MTSDASSRPAPAYQIQGKQVTLPCVVRRATSAAATFWVSARVAQELIPGTDYEVAILAPGRTLLSIASIDYIENDLGNYNEVSITFFVRPRGTARGIPYLGGWIDFFRQRLGTFIYQLPVDQSFTCEAGCTIWGFPKTVEEIDIHYEEGSTTCRLAMDGRHVLTLSLPRGGSGTMPETEMTTYTYIAGVPHRTRFVTGGTGFRMRGGRGGRIELGDHPLADELRRLGLPKKPLSVMWTEHMHGRFETAEKL